jgi:alpha-beta hydrolase superfamily lysophospholipase
VTLASNGPAALACDILTRGLRAGSARDEREFAATGAAMLKAVAMLLLLTYGEWFFRTYEMEAIYPFDAHHADPASAQVAGMIERHIAAADGTVLVVWQRMADPGRPTILYLPGNAGNLLGRAWRFRQLAARGYGFVALNWRGQGGSAGKPDEARLSADGLYLYDLFARLDPVGYGEGLGTAVAVKIAATRKVRALVLESPFTSIADLARRQYPTEDLTPYITQHWDSLAAMPSVTEPLLVLHGSADRLVPLAEGEAIFAAAGSTDKHLLVLTDEDHSGLWNAEGQKALYAFLDRF